MLFRILKNKDFFDSNPQAELEDDFSCLTSDEMKFIALVYDYDSPYKNLGKQERKEKVLDILGYERTVKGNWPKAVKDMIEGLKPKYPKAASRYLSLMKDVDKDTLVAYEEQLAECNQFMKTKNKKPSEMKIAMQMQKEMETLRSNIKNLKEELEVRDQTNEYGLADEAGMVSLSLIEEINNEEYE